MFFQGFEKLDTVNYPVLISATLWLEGCNMACGYCQNPLLSVANRSCEQTQKVSEEEVFSYLEERKNFLEGLCISGGEALLNPSLINFLRKVKKKTGLKVKIDTNLTVFDKLQMILKEGLVDFVAGDIKTSFDKYYLLLRKEADMDKIVERIKSSLALLDVSTVNLELRTTCCREVIARPNFIKMATEVSELLNKHKLIWFLQEFNNKITLDENFRNSTTWTKKELSKIKDEMQKHVSQNIEIRVRD